MANIASRIGGVLLVVGLVVLTGYGVYFFSTEFLTNEGVPLGVRLPMMVALAGALVLFAAVLGQRLRARRNENLEGAEF